MIERNRIVFTGGLRFVPNNTSDGTAAQIASYLKTNLINVTNVKGLYTKDPKKYEDAELIHEISFEEFDKIVRKIKYSAGQHFILDQNASRIIKKDKIKTIIIGNDIKNLKNLFNGKKFVGTIIS